MVTKISRISGFSRVDDGQYVGSSGAKTLNLFKLVKLYKGTPCELFTPSLGSPMTVLGIGTAAYNKVVIKSAKVVR